MSQYCNKTCQGLFFFFHFQYISRELLTSNINVFLSTYDVMKLDQNEKKKKFSFDREEASKNN